MRDARRRLALLALTLIASGVQAADGSRIVVGSKNFTEGRLLGEILAQQIERHTDLTVERRANLGGTTLVFTALQEGQIDLYAEYTGTGWAVLLGQERTISDPLETFARVERDFRRRFDLQWLAPFGFANGYALAMETERAEELGVRRISDLAAVADRLRAGVTHEFLEREDGWPGLTAAYDLAPSSVRGLEHGLAYEALIAGRVDLIDTYTTDGKLSRFDLRLLEDDRGFFPPYDAAPLVRTETLRRHPKLREILERLAYAIDAPTMQRLNHRVEAEGGTFAEVAASFLDGLTTTPQGVAPSAGEPGFWRRTLRELFPRLLQHIGLTSVAVALAILLAVPAGLALARTRRPAALVLSAAGVLQTIPSLALLALMIPIPGLGLGPRSAIAALFLYALLPILRVTVAAIRSVDPALLDVARGLGLTPRQALLWIQAPLAMRTIIAGVRVATVISIGVATLAAFVGAGGLGDPILTGLQLNDMRLVLSGAVPAACLAVLADGLMGWAERRLTPRGLRE